MLLCRVLWISSAFIEVSECALCILIGFELAVAGISWGKGANLTNVKLSSTNNCFFKRYESCSELFDTFIQRSYKVGCKSYISVFCLYECFVICVMWGSFTPSVSWLWYHVNLHPTSFFNFLSMDSVFSTSMGYLNVSFFFFLSFTQSLSHWFCY